MAKVNPLQALHDCGQAVWLDFLARRFIADGSLKRLADEDGLSGVTSNPTIFRKAITSGTDYDQSIDSVLARADHEAMGLYERVAIEDIRSAADVLLPVYSSLGGADGFVSLEVSPYIALDTNATIAEARRLWKEVARPNIMIKVPATEAGLPAIRQLLAEGINVNITLLFARPVYRRVAEAYLAALEQFAAAGGDPRRLASVASFFVSRIDTAVDKLIDQKIKEDAGSAARISGLRGKIAIANAKLAYHDYSQLFSGSRWQRLAERGARVQRLLWASTSTKNPAYRDVLYVEELIGPDTVNTMPPETVEAFRDHGKVAQTLEQNVPDAQRVLDDLERSGISLDAVTTKLTSDGVQSFADSFDELLAGVQQRRAQALGNGLNRYSAKLDKDSAQAVQGILDDWRRAGKIRGLWNADASLWTNTDESKWLGWLHAPGDSNAQLQEIGDIAEGLRKEGIKDAVLLGMGGSSLGAEVFARVFETQPGWPRLHILDSTDPAAIRRLESGLDLATTAFIVSSKSGTTLEPNILRDYFLNRVQSSFRGKAGSRFVAISDPGSHLVGESHEQGFRHVFLGNPQIGGRYSVLSVFGLVPAAMMGVDVTALLQSTDKMVKSCGANVPPEQNPGVLLGAALGALAIRGRDKVTIVASPRIAAFGAWLEQLLAESTGKEGKGFIPVYAEPLGAPNAYGHDRIFVYLRLDQDFDGEQDRAMNALESAGQPVLRIPIARTDDIGQEFFRWELATAVAGSVIGINPFNQPDVEASKVKTRELMQRGETASSPLSPVFQGEAVQLFAAPVVGIPKADSLAGALKDFFAGVCPGDYCGLLAYLDPLPEVFDSLQRIRRTIRDRKQIATCAEIGPRFLHSTGQAYKGGPNTGFFVEITGDHERDVDVPGQAYSFGKVIDATAQGDFEVLIERGRRALLVHLCRDESVGLQILERAVSDALG